MMSRAFATNGSLNGFAGTHMSAAVFGSGNGTVMGNIGLNQMLNGSVGVHTPVVTPGLGVGTMMSGFTGNSGLGNGTIMSSIGLHQPLNGSVGAPTSTVAPGLDFGGMMGSIIQDALNGSIDASTTGSSIVQTMLDIMDDMPGIHLVGLAHMNLFDAAVS